MERVGRERETWGSYTGFILTTIGSAVGIGSIWRFPYMVSTNGGASFLLVYIIVLFTFGLAFMVLEFALGMRYRTSIVSALSMIRHRFRFIGLFMIGVTVAVLSYYMVVLGWILAYLVMSILNRYQGFEEFIDTWYPLASYLAVVAINYTIVRSGLRAGVERFNKYGVIMLFAMLIPLALIGLSMDGDGLGLKYYTEPESNRLLDPHVWSSAIGQAFFSLSIGLGVLVTYASYVREQKQGVVVTSLIIVCSVLVVAFLSGLMVFTMVFANGLDDVQGTALVFIAMPKIIAGMEYGYLLGIMFFLLLFIAGITSSISMLQIPVSALEDTFKFSKARATMVITMLSLALGIPSALSYSPVHLSISSMPALDVFDWIFGTIALAVSATLMAVAVAWFMNRDEIMEQVNMNSRIRIPSRMLDLVRILLPAMIIATLLKILVFS
ncbi:MULTISPECIES: sodium-dependent transporter [Candidatus Nitrosocaldus]|jgi:NSS family neurotransmitter:Na+ symporter|uniref:Transporter n=1 Tax=Candidatus Nitrosocaldus cavascurensis TaxID=2058097 RepID=A0A2K5ARV0_9ARCH|nr:MULTISPECIES: sodium-dependent transporter [Candidatus Nitrosocaldus]SPC34324.1 putative Na: aminoacid transporter, NSS family [Candidatus Nitrosocaldus cavascurensis]